jgi:hypothetical protein
MMRDGNTENAIGLLLLFLIQIPVPAESKSPSRVTRQQLRQMVKEVAQERDADVRKTRIEEIHEKYGKPWLTAVTKHTRYQPPAQQGPTTREFVFKQTPKRELKIYVDFPADWKQTDRRPAIVLWHGGGFTQGSAGQFFHQAQYFTKRGMVVARPEYASAISTARCPMRAPQTASAPCAGSRPELRDSASIPTALPQGAGLPAAAWPRLSSRLIAGNLQSWVMLKRMTIRASRRDRAP